VNARKGVAHVRSGAWPFRFALVLFTMTAVLAMSGCGSDTEETFPPSNGEPFYAPDAVGPFAVGRRSFTIVDPDREGRELPVDVWYPVDPADATGEPSLYQVSFQIWIIPEIWVIPLVFTAPSERALQEPLISQDGEFPLIIFSHGSGGLRYQSFFLTEVLASHGFVVAAAGHVGNTLLDKLAGTDEGLSSSMMVARPLDVSFLITHMLEKNEHEGDFFYRSIDGDRIGVCGHSFGGFTSFAMAAGFGADPPDEVAALLPEYFVPVPVDPRVDAIAPLAPASSLFGDTELEAISVPTMIIGGTLDTTTPIATENVRPFELIADQVFRADLDGAVHFSFSNSCDLIQGMLDQNIPQGLIDDLLGEDFTKPCNPPSLDINEAQRITNLYTVSLFKAFVEGDERYEQYLTESYAQANEPDVTYYAKP
jgi:predicted dienelactone hydrolase